MGCLAVEDLVLEMTKCLADYPEQVNIQSQKAMSGSHMISIYCAKSDVGKIIGKHGRNANAIRQIAMAIGAKQKAKIMIEIVEEGY